MGKKKQQGNGWQVARYSDRKKKRIQRRQTAKARATMIEQQHAEEIAEALSEWGG